MYMKILYMYVQALWLADFEGHFKGEGGPGAKKFIVDKVKIGQFPKDWWSQYC